MPIKRWLHRVREMPNTLSLKREAVSGACVVAIGLALGIVAKAADAVSVVGDIGTYLGVWVFAATLVAVFSKTPFLAALRTLLFFLALLAAYYGYGQMALGFFPRAYFLGWLVIALLSPVGGFVVWFARGKGWIAVVSAALPVALLMVEGYPAYYTYKIPLIFDLCCAAALLGILPKGWKQKGFVLALSVGLAGMMNALNVLSLLPW